MHLPSDRLRGSPMHKLISLAGLLFATLFPAVALASETGITLDLTTTWFGITGLVAFAFSYALVIGEEFIHLRKSKSVVLAAGIIWILVGIAYAQHGDTQTAGAAIRHNILEYAELMLFLLSAMTFINTMAERNLFAALRGWLVSRGFSLRTVFWITGLLAFFISPIADNLTTALLMAAVVMAVGVGNTPFVILACINIVVAANAGGAFSPFGDITTLMVWQKGVIRFEEFFALFLPSLANWLIPAALMHFAVPQGHPEALKESVEVKFGGFIIVGIFMATIALTVAGHNFLHLPPVLGMMTGLGALKLFGHLLRNYDLKHNNFTPQCVLDEELGRLAELVKPRHKPFDIFISMKRAEWDTLMFFYGVVLCVGGLGTMGYLAHTSHWLYDGIGPTGANIIIGLISAIIDNIPVMFAVLTMNPDMSHGQWLLVTLTAGVGGSLLSVGSAAGVGLMGQARGIYTFFAHLKWSWAIALGYAGSIWLHFLLNKHLF